MAYKKTRSLKVYEKSDYRYRSIPMIRLCGKWLSDAGFSIGDYVSVSCEDGKLIITPDIERAKMKDAEVAFMEREMKSLQKRFEQEKKKLHLQFVAEEGSYV
ncbi:MAG: SymE family type I addiction module toxin [Lachnospiraceae bacterium]|nr:SymE family type I addiction module toxin [Lachnospiraceae bacterium]